MIPLHRTLLLTSVAIALWFAIALAAAAIASHLARRSAVYVERAIPWPASSDELERIGCDLGGCQLVDGDLICPQLEGDRYALSR